MEKTNYLRKLIKDYFLENQCQVKEKTAGVLHIQLTEEMDQQLMNRPFYWHYIKTTNQSGEPLEITMITDHKKKDKDGEWIHFGSPRFKQIINNLKQTTKYTRLYEKIWPTQQMPLFPWLLLNIKVIYKGISSREELFSIGLNLINGQMLTDMMSRLDEKSLCESISDYCYPLSSIISINSGFIRIMKVFDQYIENQNHEWAKYSMEKFYYEKELINRYFENSHWTEERARIVKECEDRYSPKIILEVINGGLFYLKDLQ